MTEYTNVLKLHEKKFIILLELHQIIWYIITN